MQAEAKDQKRAFAGAQEELARFQCRGTCSVGRTDREPVASCPALNRCRRERTQGAGNRRCRQARLHRRAGVGIASGPHRRGAFHGRDRQRPRSRDREPADRAIRRAWRRKARARQAGGLDVPIPTRCSPPRGRHHRGVRARLNSANLTTIASRSFVDRAGRCFEVAGQRSRTPAVRPGARHITRQRAHISSSIRSSPGHCCRRAWICIGWSANRRGPAIGSVATKESRSRSSRWMCVRIVTSAAGDT